MSNNGDNVNQWGLVSKTLPALVSDAAYGPIRTSQRGELINQALIGGNKMHTLADEGSYFVATNPTPGTGIAGIAAADAADDLETFLHLRNTSSTKSLYLDYIRLQVTAAGTNGVTWAYMMKTDTGVTRYTSGGSTITPVCTNTAIANTCDVTVKAGALVTAAATSEARLISSGTLRTGVIRVVGDTCLFTFGGAPGAMGVVGVAGTAVAQLHVAVPAVVVGPGHQFLLCDWAASQSGASSMVFECGFWVR